MMEILILGMDVIIHEQLSQVGLVMATVQQFDRIVETVLLRVQRSVMMVTQTVEMVVMVHEQLNLVGHEMEIAQQYDRHVEMGLLKVLKHEMIVTQTMVMGVTTLVL